jgi:hypothetical protein
MWFTQWELGYVSRTRHDTNKAYTHLFLNGKGRRSEQRLYGKIMYGVKPSLFMCNFHYLGIIIYWEKNKGNHFLGIPHKLMIDKYENIHAGVYWNDINVPGSKLAGWSNHAQLMAEGKTEDSQRRWSLIACSSSSYPYKPHCIVPWQPLHLIFKLQAPPQEMVDLKEIIN